MLDHMVERSGLRQSTGEQSKSTKGNRYYQILQMGKEKRDTRPAIVTVTGDLTIARDKQKSELLTTLLGKETAILGLPWLKSQKGIMDWTKGTLDLNSDQFTDNSKEQTFDTDSKAEHRSPTCQHKSIPIGQ